MTRHLTRLLAAYLILLFLWHLTRLPVAYLLGYLGAGVLWALFNHAVAARNPDNPWNGVATAILTGPASQNLDLLGGVMESLVIWPLGVVLSAGILLAVCLACLVRR